MKWQDRINAKMNEGYEKLEKKDKKGACRLWQETWDQIKQVMEEKNFSSIEEFKKQFDGEQFVENWMIDFEMVLDNLLYQGEPVEAVKINVLEEYVQRSVEENHNTIERKRAIAETCFFTDEKEKGDALFEELLEQQPDYGFGYIGWADMYSFFGNEKYRDLDRAATILEKALERENLTDRNDVLERLHGVYSEKGETTEAERVEKEIEKNRSASVPDWQQPAQSNKVGRNDPCPCGSGKKYKKCCLNK